ncbi:MAG: hypothetical protein IKF37_02665 [Bacilli bacterium]|nr:hypothetical protein [Bacilli bacterium]
MPNIEEKKVKSEKELLDEATKVMNKKAVKVKIKELESAVKSKNDPAEQAKIEVLNQDFKKIYDCLKDGEESLSKEGLLEKRAKIITSIKLNGADGLNVAKFNNNNAKLGIIKYKEIIREAATSTPTDSYPILDKKTANRKMGLFTGIVAGALIIGITAVGICNKIKSKINSKVNTTQTTTTSTLTGTTTTTNTPTTNTKYSMESLDVDYSSPTRDLNETNGEGYFTNPDGEYGDAADVTIEELRDTTPYDYVETIYSEEDIEDTIETVSYETTVVTQPTDTQGTVAETTEYTAPTGTDPLPIEPTVVTVDLYADSEYKEDNNTKQNSKQNNQTKQNRKVLALRLR